MTWSPAGIDAGVRASLIQAYPILLSTLLTVGRHQLSYDDGHYALIITSPPLMVYLTISSICDLLGIRTSIYKRIQSHRIVTRAFGVFILPLWLALSLALGLSKRAFNCVEEGEALTFQRWLLYLVAYIINSLFFPLTPFPTLVVASFFLLFLFRRRSQVMADIRTCREGGPNTWRILRVPWTFVKCAWYVSVIVGSSCPNLTPYRLAIDRNHKWFIYCLFTFFDSVWAFVVIRTALGLLDGYVLSYGQV